MLPDTVEDHTLKKEYVELLKKWDLSDQQVENKLPVPARLVSAIS
jgi:hypothetical protein